jgi:hypothetical protein
VTRTGRETRTARWGRSRALALAVATIAATGRDARADEPAVRSDAADVHANEVVLDARTREMLLRGDVRVDAPPFHLKSDALRVQRDARGALDVEGRGRLTFCPCLGSPLAIRFEGATVAPPGDLILRSPTLEVLGAPVLWAPYFWLRSPGKPGILPPDVAYRGADGMFLGEGVHLPWARDDASHGLDVRAGGYFEGGTAIDATMGTASTSTRVAWDHLRGDGLTLDARGVVESHDATLAWDGDAIRGGRGVRATTDLEAASRVYDRGRAETAWTIADGWTFATTLRSTTLRGGDLLDLGARGPGASLRNAGALGGAGAYDVAVEGGAIAEPGRSVTYARGEAGSLLADRWGAAAVSLALRAAGDAVADGEHVGDSRSGSDGAASARVRVAVPFARAFASDGVNDPWIHRVEPSIGAALLATHGADLLGVMPGRGLGAVRGDAWVADAALASEQGRWGARVGSEVAISGGALGSLDDGSSPRFVGRGRAALTSRPFALSAEAARVAPVGNAGGGGAMVARVRVGAVDGIHLTLLAAERDGIDPVAARALTDAPVEPSGGFLASSGWTVGARARIPWTSWLATTGGADGDLTAQVLVAARGGIELRDHCGCLVVRANGAHRIGRDGVDVWVTIDLAAH